MAVAAVVVAVPLRPSGGAVALRLDLPEPRVRLWMGGARPERSEGRVVVVVVVRKTMRRRRRRKVE